jgi:ABC-type glycerol-3-phosphate transport system permease component
MSFVMLTPLLWMLATALTPNTLIASSFFLPQTFTLENFPAAWNFPAQFNNGATMGTFFLNSLFVTVLTTLAGVIVDALAAYVLAFKHFAGMNLFLYLALATLMVPVYITIVPEYLIVRTLKWLNSYQVLIIPFLSSGMGIYLFRSYFLAITTTLEECAKLDGASDLRTWAFVIMPVAKPAVATMIILKSMWSWNQYIWPLIVINNVRMYTIQLSLNLFKGLNFTQWGYLCAGMTIAVVPLILVFLMMQKYFITDLMAGAVKG